MRSTFPVLALMASCLCAQTPRQNSPDLVEITPDTVIATVNGQKFTAGDLKRITQNLSPGLRSLAGSDPKKFLEQYALGLTLQTEAMKARLQETAPYRERIAAATRDILVKGVIAEREKNLKIAPDEIQKKYDANKSDYRQAKVRVIFVSREGYQTEMASGKTKTTSPEEARDKVAKVAKLAREGGDFVQLAKEYSDDRATAEADAVFPFPIRANSMNVPSTIIIPVLSAKPNEIVGPIEHNTGYYLFRVDSAGQASLDEVKDEIEKELRKAAVNRWIADLQKKSTVTLDHEAFWKTFLAANEQQQQEKKKDGGAK